MTNAIASNVAAQECKANSTEFVIQKPCAGSNIMVDISKGEPTAFNFAVEDVRAMKLLADGGLLISFVDGSTLTVSNFKEARETFPFSEIKMSDGTVVNLDKLAQGLASTLPNDTVADLTILKPAGANATSTFDLAEGKTYVLGFDMKDVAGVEAKGDDLIVTFKDGSVLALQNYESATDGVIPPQMTLADGSVIPAAQLINVLNVAVADQVKDVQPAAGETSADAEAQVAAKQVAQKQADPNELAAIEPAAGTPGAGGAGGAGGYGFNSSVDATNITPLAAVGPIGPTSLAFSEPQLKLVGTDAVAAAPATTTLVSPDRQTFEDTQVNLLISASSASPSESVLTLTISNIPTGWGVNTGLSGGTFDSVAGTWTITLPQGSSYAGGPYLIPPHDSDADIKLPTHGPLLVTVDDHNVVSGTHNIVSDDMNVVVDAVADQPDLAVNNVAGSDNGPIPLDIQAAVVDVDGSEVLTTATLTGIPAGFTLNHGTYDAGTQTWTMNASDLSTLVLTPVRGYDGFFDVTVRVNNLEQNLTDDEITLSNNTNFNTETFRVTVVDTAPIVGDSVASVDDTTLSGGPNVATGSVSINYQIDTPGTFTLGAANTFTSTGSKLSGQLSSNGSLVTVTLAGNTYTGKDALGNTVFTMQIQTNGQYTFTQYQQLDHADGSNPNDVIDLNFTVTGTDFDGDADNGVITVHVLDDAPVAVADSFVSATDSATGNVTTNDDSSEDTFTNGAANHVYDVVFGGETKTVPTDGSNVTFTNGAGTLTINMNGVFTYTPPVPGQDATFKYRLIDYDNDKSAATADAGTTVTIDLDGKPSITGSAVSVDETNLDDTGLAQTIAGTYTFNYGADGAGSIVATGYTGPALTSNGVAVTVTEGPTGVFTGKAGATTVFTMTINTNGTYSFTQFDQLDHPNANDPNDALNLTFGLTIADSDGDIATASLTAVVRDDGPVAVNDNFVSATSTATGNIMANDDVGADEPGRVFDVTFGGETKSLPANGTDVTFTNGSGTLVINSNGVFTFTPPIPGQGVTFTYHLIDSDNDKSVVDAQHGTVTVDTNGTPTITGSSVTTDDTNLSGGPQTVAGTYTFGFGGDGQGAGGITNTGYTGPALTSNGQAVTVTLVGNTYTGKTAGGVTVFTMTVGTNGTYSFTQNEQLDHSNANDPNDALNLTFGLKITDADGSAATATLTAVVRDDGPIAVNDNFVASTGTASGNIITNDDFSEDTFSNGALNHVYDVVFGGETRVLPTDGSNTTITNAAGTLTINMNGQFTFTPPQPGQDVTFTYRLVDYDNDKSAVDAQHGTVTITTDAQPIIGDAAITTDETSLVAGPAITNGSVSKEFYGDGPGTVTATGAASFESTGSKLSGNLTSHSSPVTVTLASNIYTGKDGLGNTVFTLKVNTDGTFVFTQFEQLDHNDGNNPNDIITLKFGVTGTDNDGDIDTGLITVNVRDDAPAAQNDLVNLEGGKVATGNILTNDIKGQDTPVPVTQITYNGTTYTVPANGTNLTINAVHGTLVINNTGAYTYTAKNAVPGDDDFTYKITDYDNDSSTAVFKVTVTDIDYVPVVGDSTVTVDETGLSPITASNSISANYFDDGPGTLKATNGFSSDGSKLNGALTSNGAAVSVALNGNTYTGTANGQTVFTLVLQNNGNYTYTQFKPLDHKDAENANDTINLKFTVIGTDADGDTDTGVITVVVRDDAPIAVNDTLSVANVTPATGNVLANDDLSTDTPNLITSITYNGANHAVPANGSNLTINGAHGTLVINNTGAYTYTSNNSTIGNDVFTYTVKDYDQDPATATFTATVTDVDRTPNVTVPPTSVDEGGSHTTSGKVTADWQSDVPGTFMVCSGNNFSATGSMTNGVLSSAGVGVVVTSTSTGYVGTANGQTVFSLTLASNGDYTFTQFKPLDHADGTNPSDVINLNFQVCAKDGDGDVGHTTLTVKVIDDAPVAANDTTIFCASDGLHNGNMITGYHNSNGGVDDATSFDSPVWLYSVTGANGSAIIKQNGAAAIEGQYGTLHVFDDGSYVYTLKPGAGKHTDTFTYLLKDGDGDTESATLKITGVDTYINDDIILVNGSKTGTSGADILVAYTQGVADTMYGEGGNDALYGWSGNDKLHGGSGNDLLRGEYGADQLWGDGGTDIFAASRDDLDGGYAGTFYDTVKDFSAGQGDVIDLSALIDNGSAAQNSINSYVRAVNQGSDTMLQVRSDGSGSWKNAMLIENHTNMDVQTLLTNGNLDVT